MKNFQEIIRKDAVGAALWIFADVYVINFVPSHTMLEDILVVWQNTSQYFFEINISVFLHSTSKYFLELLSVVLENSIQSVCRVPLCTFAESFLWKKHLQSSQIYKYLFKMGFLNFSCYNIKRLIDAIKGVVRLYHNSTMAWTTNQLLFHLAGMVYYCLINIHYIESRIHIADCFSGKNLVTFWPVTKMGRGLQILVTKSEKGEGSSNSSNFFGGEVDDVR